MKTMLPELKTNGCIGFAAWLYHYSSAVDAQLDALWTHRVRNVCADRVSRISTVHNYFRSAIDRYKASKSSQLAEAKAERQKEKAR